MDFHSEIEHFLILSLKYCSYLIAIYSKVKVGFLILRYSPECKKKIKKKEFYCIGVRPGWGGFDYHPPFYLQRLAKL